MKRTGISAAFFCALTAVACCFGQDAAPAAAPAQATDSLEKQSFITQSFPGKQWQFYSGKQDAVLSQTWSVVTATDSTEPVLICKGEPYGYIRTAQTFTDFEMGLEWRYPHDPNGNSGILLYTSGDDRIRPSSLQVQLHQPEAGSTFPVGGAKSDNELRNVPQLSRPVNQWNQCTITSQHGKVTVTINGQKVGEVQGCRPLSGSIALQAEGSEIHFRQIWIRDLESTRAAESPPAPEKPDDNSPSEATFLLPRGRATQGAWVNWDSLARHGKRKTPLVTRPISQGARGEKRLNAEWVRLQTRSCDN